MTTSTDQPTLTPRIARPRTFAQAEAVLAQALPGYESRPHQRRLATEIENEFFGGARQAASPVIVQGVDEPVLAPRAMFGHAPTGSGKSLAYLIPAILSGQRVVVSVTTKSLQEQLAGSDLPFLQEHLGVPFTWAVLKGRSNYLCLTAETKVMTRDGYLPIGSLAGGEHEVVDGNGNWVRVPIREYGQDRLMKITLTRHGRTKTIHATADHRWFVQAAASGPIEEITTAQMVDHPRMRTTKGLKLAWGGPRPVTTNPRLMPSPFGVARGVVYGDGTVYRQGGASATVVLHGAKDAELLRYFEGHSTSRSHQEGYAEPQVQVFGLPRYFKDERPALDEASSYLYGWLAGYFAADGCVTEDGHCSISSASRETLEYVEKVCIRLGIMTSEIRTISRTGKGAEESDLHSISLSPQTLGDDFFVLSSHADRIQRVTHKRHRAARRWTVTSVEETDRVETVYCAEVPTTHSFVLEGNILTGNCMNRVREMIGNGEAPAPVQALAHLVEQADENFSGLREDIDMDIPDDLWWRISGSEDECDALDCKDDDEGNCYLYRARRRALSAQIVVVNHALYCNDMSVRKMTAGNFSLLGKIDWTILDEAHEFHEVALSSLATRLTEASFVSLVNNVRTWMSNNADPQALGNAERFMGQIVAGARALFAALPTSRSGEALRIRGHHLEPLFDASASLMDALSELSEVLISVRPQGEPEVREKAKKRQTSLVRRIVNASSSLNALLTADLSEYVRWTETERTRRGPRLVLKMSPVDISEHLRSHLFAYHPVLMVSATLAVRGTFDFQADQLGVDNWTGTIVGTSFDHAANTRLYVPLTLPAPNQDGWESAAINEMRSLIAAAGGRTLVLFTSVAHMRRTYEVLKDALPYPVKVQGQESTSALKDWFLADPETVLLATKSFMTGFDARGETLSQVIITKMPFPVPTDPMFEARSELVKRRGGSDFADLSIPTMSIVLQQAVGRLMRHSTDMGVVAILDHRMISKGYGKQIVRDLPPMTLVKDRAEAEAFLLDTAKHFARSAS